jgi:RHH-type proline utilization regulon transcriptional repressor/proline dehydrogenase/delta 1-pyrroline-5-carboxylate dehydrogenase
MTLTTDRALDALATDSCANARQLILDAERLRTRRERANRKRFARLLRDRRAIEVTMTLTDEVMRVSSRRSAAGILRSAARRSSVAGFGLLNAVGLRLVALVSRVTPVTAVSIVHARVRGLSQDLILASEVAPLLRHLETREREGIQLNINVLGEAVLGEREANERFERVLEMMSRAHVDYVSVKLSSVVSQLTMIDHEGSLSRVSDKLRLLYRASVEYGVFVNLDMEEFRDLRLTVDAFRSVLSEPEFETLNAGIVLQAYLPDSHDALEELLFWAKVRFAAAAAASRSDSSKAPTWQWSTPKPSYTAGQLPRTEQKPKLTRVTCVWSIFHYERNTDRRFAWVLRATISLTCRGRSTWRAIAVCWTNLTLRCLKAWRALKRWR